MNLQNTILVYPKGHKTEEEERETHTPKSFHGDRLTRETTICKARFRYSIYQMDVAVARPGC